MMNDKLDLGLICDELSGIEYAPDTICYVLINTGGPYPINEPFKDLYAQVMINDEIPEFWQDQVDEGFCYPPIKTTVSKIDWHKISTDTEFYGVSEDGKFWYYCPDLVGHLVIED